MKKTNTKTKRVDLWARYEAEIRSWDWAAIADHARENLYISEQELFGSSYLGSVLQVYPSGKVYAPWTSNQTAFDVVRDLLFGGILESVAEEYGLSVGGGDGDGCDLFARVCLGDDYLIISSRGDEMVARDAWGNEVFSAPAREFDDGMRAHMEAEGFFPDLVSVSDHGDVNLYTLDA